jgi:hypothetical protein
MMYINNTGDQMNTYKKISGYGPGGRNCPCCGCPAPGKGRKKFDRAVKRHEKMIAKKAIDVEIDNS